MADITVVAQLRPAPSKHLLNSLHPHISVVIAGVAAAYPFEAGKGARVV